MYNLCIAGAAGQGIETMAGILEKILKRSGFYVFTVKDFMSRVRGGHNFTSIRFGNSKITSHSWKYDLVLAMNEESFEMHEMERNEKGYIITDSIFSFEGERVIKIPMDQIADELGNYRMAGSVAIGVILKSFHISMEEAQGVLSETFKEEVVLANLNAVKKGFESAEILYDATPGEFKEYLQISGSEAVGLGALAAGLTFYSAYPMSPSTSVMEYLASVQRKAGIVVEQAEDEIAGINMALGASFAGAVAMTGTSGGGFCLKVEALGFSGIAEIPIVIIDVMRPGPATGLPTRTEQSDLSFVITASQGEFPRMVIALKDQEDSFYQTFRAFQLAEKYQIPVILLSDQYIGDGNASVKPFDMDKLEYYVPNRALEEGEEYLRYKITDSGISKRLIPGQTKALVQADSDEHNEYGWIIESAEERIAMMDKRLRKIDGIKTELIEPEFYGEKECREVLIGWGSVTGSIKEAVDLLNKKEKGKYAALLFGDVYPLPVKRLNELFSKNLKFWDIEQNATGQLGQLIRMETGHAIENKILKYDGRQIRGEEIFERIWNGGE